MTDEERIYTRIATKFDFDEEEIQSRLQDFMTRGNANKIKPKTEALVDRVIYARYSKMPPSEANPELISQRNVKIKIDIQNEIFNSTSQEVDILFDRLDILRLKTFKASDKKTNEYAEAVTYNAVLEIERQRRNANDISGLERLKEDIMGLPDEDELTRGIDDTISRLKP